MVGNRPTAITPEEHSDAAGPSAAVDADGQQRHSGFRASLEGIGAVSGGLLVLGTIAGLLGVTGWLALGLVVIGGLGLATGVGRWRSSRPTAVAGAVVALVSVVGLGVSAATAPPTSGDEDNQVSPAEQQNVLPLKVAVGSSADECSTGWVVPVPPADLAPLPGWADDPSEWITRLRGIPADSMMVTFTVDGVGLEKVTIHDIRVVDVKALRPSTGTRVVWVCGGGSLYRYMLIDFDANPPKRTFHVDENSTVQPRERRPISFPYVVSSVDPESFEVIAHAKKASVEWALEIDWSFQGKTGVLRVDDNGSPFRISGAAAVTASCAWLPDNMPADGSSPGCPAG